MKSPTALVFAALLASAASLPLAAQKKALTVEQAIGAGDRVQYYTSPQTIRWAPDGQHYAMRREGKSVWVHPETGAVVDSPEDAPAERPRFGRSGAPRIPEKKLRELVGDDQPVRIATPSPDEKWASFVRDGNLSVVEVESVKPWRVTEDGSDQMLYGVLDWVYQEEIYGRGDFRGHWWSGDSRALAFLGLDQAEVLPFPDYQEDGSFLWQSERTGYRHVYHHEADGTLRRALTSGTAGSVRNASTRRGPPQCWQTSTSTQ